MLKRCELTGCSRSTAARVVDGDADDSIVADVRAAEVSRAKRWSVVLVSSAENSQMRVLTASLVPDGKIRRDEALLVAPTEELARHGWTGLVCAPPDRSNVVVLSPASHAQERDVVAHRVAPGEVPVNSNAPNVRDKVANRQVDAS